MPQSNKGLNAQRLKANRAAGIGDEKGRLPARVKTGAIMICCEICRAELKCTKTNTEMKLHAESKHGKNLEECFPGAEAEQKALAEKLDAGKGGAKGKAGDSLTKAERKKKTAAMADDLLLAGLSSGKKSNKKR
mmetsp:Transcript_10439/g.30545  ORF Transcript_10439/g.30545 Transcript_10439/m.30545 type:complete len:134 (-) Transcript_10439:362-763(-)|eukprot:CAMPEP_0172376716 /NCGR_PEP_ID=MMETSP1060-20121228/68527_1 /TAXON_ID=37318 /ORGANISM="Pseudo-nitzschia pungens, Strain cf. cingulata" /LENGTH=133 /DNA_ID=CAMNT_0013104373 /DNA_START=51 /DNA_END=452 /DNA_ORIENTATION=+